MSKKPQNQQANNEEDVLDPRNVATEDVLGAKEWERSKVGYLTGLSSFFRAGRSALRPAEESSRRLHGVIGMFFSSDKSGRAVDEAVTGDAERFEAAMFVNGRTQVDILKSLRTTYLQFWTYAALMALTVAFGIYTLVAWGPSLPLFQPIPDILFRAIPLPVLGALMLRAGYTNWMFRNKKLAPLSEYLSSSRILPKSPGNKQQKNRAMKSLAILATMMLSLSFFALDTSPAMAQTTPDQAAQDVFNDGESGDLFIDLLGFMVPGVGPVPVNPDISIPPIATATKTAFMYFSATLLFIGSIFSGWQILSGLVASAKEGSVLGKRYHEVWAPARLVIGYGMLAPIAGGLCAAQIIVLYMIVWGGNLANIVWSPFVDTLISVESQDRSEEVAATMQSLALHSSNSLVKSVLEKEICHATIVEWHNRNNMRNYGYYTENPRLTQVSHNLFAGLGNMVSGRNASMYSIDYGTICGSINVEVLNSGETIEDEVEIIVSNAQKDTLEDILIAMRGESARSLMQDIASSYQNPNAENIRYFERTPEEHDELVELVHTARVGFATRMGEAHTSAYRQVNPIDSNPEAVERFRSEVNDKGWAAAGTFFTAIARVQNSAYMHGTSIGSEFVSGNNMSPNYHMGDLEPFFQGTPEQPGTLAAFDAWWADNIQRVAPDFDVDAMTVASDQGSVVGFLNSFFLGAAESIHDLLWSSDDNMLNPMQTMIDFGNRLMAIGWTILGAFVLAAGQIQGSIDAASGVSLGLSNFFGGGVIQSMLSTVGFLVQMFALVLIAAGAVHSYIIPLIPYIMVLFFVGGMLILTVEALIAAPLWAFFHIRMDGDEFVSQVQQPGYMIAFNLILRPSLMILGLILSFMVFAAMSWLIEITFFPAARSMTATQGLGPIGLIIMVVMISYLHYQTAIRAFSLINQVPDRVTRWFGQGGERLGEDADAEKSTNFIVGNTTQRVETGLKVGAIKSATTDPEKKPSPNEKEASDKAGSKPLVASSPGGAQKSE